jgi:hypothetical protein
MSFAIELLSSASADSEFLNTRGIYGVAGFRGVLLAKDKA